MINVLLTSSTFIKSITNISDNLQDKVILPCLREAQDIDLKGVIGENLLDKVKNLIKDREINAEGNEVYKDLLEKCQYFLAYQTISRLCVVVSYKIDNLGVSKTRDDNADYASFSEVTQLEQYYQEKADFYKLEVQNFCLNNKAALPELTSCVCHKIEANLYSTATSGLFLGSKRGKINKGNNLRR